MSSVPLDEIDPAPLFVVVDVETTMNGEEESGLSHPMHPHNSIVLAGICDKGVSGSYSHMSNFETRLMHRLRAPVYKNKWLCGHNVSFDLLYLYKTFSKESKEYLQTVLLWDTQLAHYILSGQKDKFISLDELCDLYKLPKKDDKVTSYFKAGLGADKVPLELLSEYLKHDLIVTEKIAYKQYEEAVTQKQLALIKSQMLALHATTEMKYNGLYVDKEKLANYTVEVVNAFAERKVELESFVPGLDINSAKQWSEYFFGGTRKVKVKEPAGLFKNGNIKYKTVEKIEAIPALVDKELFADRASEATGRISVDDQVLQEISEKYGLTVGPTAEALLRYREVSKQLSTYVLGLSNHVIGEFIHGTLNHTATVTGRLSSTSPNLQNISNNPIKKIFTSRFSDGVIVEVDFKQLEVVALANITHDKQLIHDISSGVDIHSALFKELYGYTPSKEERKPFKARTFQLIYGAGANAISKQAKCSLEEAKQFIQIFYKRYPQVAAWHSNFALLAETAGVHLMGKDGTREKGATFVHQTGTGRKYVFKEYYNEKAWSKKTYTYSPTELKNYPVQGLATGDIVPMMLGVLFEKFRANDQVRLVNTIHDSIMFDVQLSYIGEFLVEVTNILKNTHKFFEETFKFPLALKLDASASYGTNWFEMEEISL